MLSRRVVTSRHLSRALKSSTRTSPSPRTTLTQIRWLSQAEIEDPEMNGGYLNPPAEKHQFRDPYADWWDKQERRNYGEPLHEDYDMLAMFSPEEYTHTAPAKGFFQLGCFVAAVGVLCGLTKMFYPDKPSAPRVFPGGLEEELGGPRALRARKPGEGW